MCFASSLLADLDLEGLRRRDLEARAAARDRGVTASREVGGREAATDLAEGAGHVGGVDPVGALLAVDAQLERAGRTGPRCGCRHRPVSSREGATRSLSVISMPSAARTSPTVSPRGVDGLGLPVEGQRHRLAEGCVAQRRAADGDDDDGHEGREEGSGPAEVCDACAHDAPNVELPGPRSVSAPTCSRTAGGGGSRCERGLAEGGSYTASGRWRIISDPGQHHKTITGSSG